MDTPAPFPLEPERQPAEEKEGQKPRGKRPPANSLAVEAERLKELMKKLGIDEPEQDKP